MGDLQTVVRKLRRERGWTQGQLALYSGVSRASIAFIETGERKTPTVETISKIAGALKVSVDYILAEAGFLAPIANPGPLSPSEKELVQTIRSIPSENIRSKVLELATGFATVARDADAARDES